MNDTIPLLTSRFERRFLARSMPEYVRRLPQVGSVAIYIPEEDESRALCLLQRGSDLEMVLTISTAVPGHMRVYTLPLNMECFDALCTYKGPALHKLSYYPPGYPWCFDGFLGNLKGLVLVRFWFSSLSEMHSFAPPDFALPFVLQEVTHNPVFSDGRLAGTSYKALEECLRQYSYFPL